MSSGDRYHRKIAGRSRCGAGGVECTGHSLSHPRPEDWPRDRADWRERGPGALPAERALPQRLVCDNVPEFTSQALDQWAYERRITLQFFRPGKPIENAYLEDARVTIEHRRHEYNAGRPHSSLEDRTPEEFTRALATTAHPLTQRIGPNNRTKKMGQVRS